MANDSEQDFFTLAGVAKVGELFWRFLDITNNPVASVNVNHGLKGCLKTNTKSRSVHMNVAGDDMDDSGGTASIHWGEVEEILCSRDIGFTSVPNHGGYPLGLGAVVQPSGGSNSGHRSRGNSMDISHVTGHSGRRSRGNSMDISHVAACSSGNMSAGAGGGEGDDSQLNVYSLEEHIALRQQDLHQRALVCKDGTAPVLPEDGTGVYETRTYDYKRGKTNPYFGPTVEALRITMLLRANDEQRGTGKRRVSSSGSARGDGASISALLVDINKDVRLIQQSRSSSGPTPPTLHGQFEGGSGCSCHVQKLDKLTVPKLKAMLVGLYKRVEAESESESGVPVPPHAPDVVIVIPPALPSGGDIAAVGKMTRAELLTRIREANKSVKECGLCSTLDCECMAAGVPCSYSTCLCLKHISVMDKQILRKRSRSLSIDLSAGGDGKDGAGGDVEEDGSGDGMTLCSPCCNPAGLMGLYDSEMVRAHRRRIMAEYNPANSSSKSDLTSSMMIPIPEAPGDSSPATPSDTKKSQHSGSGNSVKSGGQTSSPVRQGKTKTHKRK